MARGANQKRKLPVLAKLLLEKSDEEHPVSLQAMLAELERWDISAERKSIYDDMAQLAELGLDVQHRGGKDGGWFVGERDFELAELKLLVDAVQSSRFLTEKKSAALIKKLAGLASVHQAKQLQRQVYVDRRIKTMNESIFYSVDKLHTAVAANVLEQYRKATGDNTLTVVASTASPYKFAASVLPALTAEAIPSDGFAQLEMLAKLSNTPIPAPLANLKGCEVRHKNCIEKSDMAEFVLDFLK